MKIKFNHINIVRYKLKLWGIKLLGLGLLGNFGLNIILHEIVQAAAAPTYHVLSPGALDIVRSMITMTQRQLQSALEIEVSDRGGVVMGWQDFTPGAKALFRQLVLQSAQLQPQISVGGPGDVAALQQVLRNLRAQGIAMDAGFITRVGTTELMSRVAIIATFINPADDDGFARYTQGELAAMSSSSADLVTQIKQMNPDLDPHDVAGRLRQAAELLQPTGEEEYFNPIGADPAEFHPMELPFVVESPDVP